MKTENLLKETKVAYYGNMKYNKPLYDISLYDWITTYSLKHKDTIDYIRRTNAVDEKYAKALKGDKLPCVTISAHFDGYRQKSRLTYYNPVICLDIDKGDNPQITDWDELKQRLIKLPYIMYVSLSCRGEGVFCLAYYDTNKNFLKVWKSMRKDLLDMDIVIDDNCKDETRLRFLSYDDKAYIRKEVVAYDKEIEEEEKVYSNDNTTINEDDVFIFNAIRLLINKGYRANTYQTWLMDGFRLSTLGERGKILFMYLSQKSDNYDESVALDKFRECYRSSRMNKSCLIYYFARLKELLGSDWKNIVKNS